MISAELAPAPARIQAAYSCGPVQLLLEFDDALLRDALHGLLSQYDAPWAAATVTIRIVVERGERPIAHPEPSGSYLQSYRLRVDRHGARLLSLSEVGVWMEFDMAADRARIVAPLYSDWPTVVEEVEQQLVLLLARAWAQAGWTPLHAGTLIPPGDKRCVLLCAPSGVGKTTLIAALLRRGWHTLGDDKTLLRIETNGGVIARGLARRFHLHPHSSRWFPETGDFSAWPRYSRWTEKRVVQIEQVWRGRLLGSATPAAVVRLERGETGLAIEPLDAVNGLKTLVNQVAMPSDGEHSRPLVSCVAAAAMNAKAALIKIGHEAFADLPTMNRLDHELRNLVS